MGDGTFGSFNVISDAVYCAGELVKACLHENITIRVGIHFGGHFLKQVFGIASIQSIGQNHG